jgi:hypothetical protein
MVCHFVSDSHEVMTALIVMLPIIVLVEISLQLHQASFNFVGRHFHCSLHWVYFCPITIQEAMSIYEIQVNQFM